jgi:DNA-binding protein HU-beta
MSGRKTARVSTTGGRRAPARRPRAAGGKAAKPAGERKTAVRKARGTSKAAMVSSAAEAAAITKKQADRVFESIRDQLVKDLKADGETKFYGLFKLTRKRTPPRPARTGRNPQTGASILIKAKPAGQTVRARVLKPFKDLVL